MTIVVEPTVDVAWGDWTAGLGGYYADDLQAIQAGARPDGLLYTGVPRTRGHRAVRNPSLAVLVRLVDADGLAAWGDVVATQYSGMAGRDRPIDPREVDRDVVAAIDALATAGPLAFADGCAVLESLRLEGLPLHTGVRYGVSQALLQLASARAGCSAARLLMDGRARDEPPRVPIYAQSGEERRRNVDKMILKRVDVLPHGLINSVESFGSDGGLFLEYAAWVRSRVLALGEADHRPLLHFDIYGLLGRMTGNDVPAMAAFCRRLAEACLPLDVQLESPAYGATMRETGALLAELRGVLGEQQIDVRLVADDWCNSLEDIAWFLDEGAADVIQIKTPDLGAVTNVLEAADACRARGVAAFVGGSCSETDLSARVSAHLAVAAGAQQVLAKPGMGVDEGVMIVHNEMARIAADWRRPARTVS